MLADLKMTKLKGTLLRDVKLELAQFSKEQLVEATVLHSTVAFLLIFSKESSGFLPMQEVEEQIGAISQPRPGKPRGIVNGWWGYNIGRAELLCILVNLLSGELLDPMRTMLSRYFKDIALYVDEYNRLIQEYPDFNRILSDIVRRRQ
jgi:hypothetical protein